jgi:hypothetical protein
MFDFDEVGKDIKGLARTLGYIIFAGFVISAIACFFSGIAIGNGAGLLMLLLAVVILVIGYFVSRVSVMLLYGFGELIDNVMSINDRVRNLGKRNITNSKIKRDMCASDASFEDTVNDVKSQPVYEEMIVQNRIAMEVEKLTAERPESARPEMVDENTVVCPVCGRNQRSGRKCCWDCGVKFDS